MKKSKGSIYAWGVVQYALVLSVLWTLLAAGLILREARQGMEVAHTLLRNEARSGFRKNLAFRLWGASHGGVYVPPTEHTPPNPYLTQIPDRDVVTVSGKKLTLMNPAYMLRQLMEDYEELYGIRGHLTSLTPLRPENAPDAWERAALESFERGETEARDFSDIDGKPYLRLMRPVFVEKACLKCHAQQGYKEGDVRGGIGVSVPAEPFFSAAHAQLRRHALNIGLVWLVGLLGMLLVTRHLQRRVRERNRAEKQVVESLREKEVLLREIHHRVKNNMQVIVSLLRMHSRRINDARLGEVFDDCRDRVSAMSLVHEALYQSEDLAKIDFEVYLSKLCNNLSHAHGVLERGISVTVGRGGVSLGVDQGIAVGMVISELVSNSFKYAYPEGEGGEVSISLSNLDDGEVELVVADNGIGMPPDMDIFNSPSLGLELVVSAVTNELGGHIAIEQESGTRYRIRFRAHAL